MQSLRSTNWYKRIILLIGLCMFTFFSIVYIIILGFQESTSSKWLLDVYNFILALYPNVFIIPFAFIFPLLFYFPIKEAERLEEEEKLIEKIREKLIPSFRHVVVNEQRISSSLLRIGITSIDETLDVAVLKARIAESKQRVFILENWICQNLNELEDALYQAVSNSASLKILLLDPDSVFAKQRSFDLDHEEHHVPHLIRGNIASLKLLHKKLHMENLEVRLHNSLPSLQMFICDDEALVGFFMHRVDSQYNPQLHVSIKDNMRKHTTIGKRIENEFEVIWRNATPVSLN